MSHTVVSLSPKSAAIYYDRIVPVGLGLETMEEYGLSKFLDDVNSEENKSIPDKIQSILNLDSQRDFIQDLLPESLAATPELVMRTSLSFVMLGLLAGLLEYNVGRGIAVKAEYAHLVSEDQFDRINEINKFTLEDFDVILKNIDGEFVFDFVVSGGCVEKSSSLILCSAHLIDVSSASWDKIIEFRKDKLARAGLLRFRKFFYDSFTGKTHSYIQEELERLKFDYDEAAKKHGFELTKQSITSILSARAIGGGGLMGFVASQAGLGPASMIAAAAPIVAEFGIFAFQLYGNKHSRSEFQASHPISYLTKLEDELLKK